MKRIVLIVLALMLLAVATCVVLIAAQPKPSMTIRAIGPTGQTWTGTNGRGEEVPGEMWLFAVTNTGRATANCILFTVYASTNGTEPPTFDPPGTSLKGSLPPSGWIVTNMALPRRPEGNWCAGVF